MGDLSHERFPLFDSDPRAQLSDAELDAASRNAFPVVAADRRGRDRAGLMLGAAVALMLGTVTFVSLSRSEKPVAKPASPSEAVPKSSASTLAAPLEDGPKVPAEALTVAGGAPQLAQPAPSPVLAKAPAGMGIGAPASAPVMVFDNSASLTPAPGAPAGSVTGGAAAPAGLSDNETFGSRVGNAGAETAVAVPLANPGTTLTQGTLIPAILETAIDSDLPGYVRAVVSQDVLSFDGKRVLVPRSSRIIGQYKSGLAAGQTRIYVIWTRLIRPDGASVALASPAIEFSGSSGLSGEVNSHFLKRFGAASLLSVIGGLGAIASGGALGLVIGSGSQSAASVAASTDAQIRPTIRVAPGQPVRLFTARDLDFSGVTK